MQVLSKHLQNLLGLSFRKNNFFIGKTIVEIISVAISDSSDVLFFDIVYLINTFEKSAKAERCIDVMLKLTLYCLSITVGNLTKI